MTNEPTLRAALEQWRKSEDSKNAAAHPCPVDNAFLDGYRAALAAPSAEQAKPEAWIERRYMDGELILETVNLQPMQEVDRDNLRLFYQLEIIPLYATPQPQPAIPAAPEQQVASDTELRQRVARAICIACDERPDHSGDAKGNESRWQDYLNVADAAIAACRVAQQAAPEQATGKLTPSEAKQIRELALELEITGRITSLTDDHEKRTYMMRNRAVQCALEDLLTSLTFAPNPPKNTGKK